MPIERGSKLYLYGRERKEEIGEDVRERESETEREREREAQTQRDGMI